MSAPTFEAPTAPRQQFERDGYKRPKIKPPTGDAWTDDRGRVQAFRSYTRATTYAGALDDGQGLAPWKAAQALRGAARRPDYVMAAAALGTWDQDKTAWRELVELAVEAAGESASLIGTALHSFTERLDRGEDVGAVPPAFQAHLTRYAQLVAPLTFTHHEVPMVCDQLEVAGTPDRLGYCAIPDPDGVTDALRIIDTKSGKLGPAVPKMSAQLATYAHSALYDVATGARTPLEGVSTKWGLIVHLPAKATAAEIEAGAGDLLWINLEHGWAGVSQLAGDVRAWRKVRGDTLLEPVRASSPAKPQDVPTGTGRDSGDLAVLTAPETPGHAAAAAVLAAVTTADLAQLWREHGSTWGPDLQAWAAVRHRELAELEDLTPKRAALLAAITTADGATLGLLWSQHGGGPVWVEEHTAAASARHAELQAAAA